MRKILFSLVALVAAMSMNAQVMKIYKDGAVVASYNAAQMDSVVYAEPTNMDANWVQLWKNGPKFAEFNVGVTDGKAESYGGYYAWGGSQDKVDDHNTGTTNLSGNDDTATNLWGSKWRMPTQAELQALLDSCDVEWTTVNGVNGCKFTGKGAYASNSVFLPAAGSCSSGNVSSLGDYGYYWSSTPSGRNYAYRLSFNSGSKRVNDVGRILGISVRAVLAE